MVSDIDTDRRDRIAREYGARISSAQDILLYDADIFAPCALGGVLTRKTAGAMKARLVCGAANNQLADPGVADLLLERGIVYVPDYVANAGGIINASAEYLEEDEDQVALRVARIGLRVQLMLEEAARTKRSPAVVADQIAEGIMAGWDISERI